MSVSSLTYDNMYRVTGKSQHLSQTGVQFDGTLSAGYDLKYAYCGEEGKRFQLAGVDDVNYSAEAVTEESKVVNAHAYEYDANGNLVFVNTSRTKKDGQTTPNAGERKLKWDEENRLTASDDNGFVTSYWYDASGERTVKSSGENAAMFVNAEFAGGMTNTAKFSLYVSPYLVANQGGRYTKHIYIGSQRIVSKLGDMKSYGADPRRIEYAGSESDGPKVDYKSKYAQQQQVIKDNFAHFDVPYNGADNNDYVDGKGFSERDGSLKSAMLKAASLKDNFQQGDSYEQYQYFYHPDHLGSSSFITNTDGEVVQHIEYVPYGEVFIEERNNVWNTPYLFNAKEFDEETGLYYYGARYYDSRLAMWYGVDALAEKYPNMGGYVYCHGNPIVMIDPDGNDAIFICFPDYKIDTEIMNPITNKTIKASGLGHAGILLIDNKTGKTRYYEYGRYKTLDGTKGKVRNLIIPNCKIKDGKPTQESLDKVLNIISEKAGQSGNIEGAYVNSEKFTEMDSYAKSKLHESTFGKSKYNKDREPYDLFSNNCATFVADVINQDESVETPWFVTIKSPTNMVNEYQEEGYAKVQFNANTKTTTITESE